MLLFAIGNVSLTTEGLFLIDEARVILGHCDKFLENVNSLRLGYKGQLKSRLCWVIYSRSGIDIVNKKLSA